MAADQGVPGDLVRVPKVRTGRRIPGHLYIQTGPEPDEHADPCIGTVATPQLGKLLALAVNAWLESHPEDTALLESFRPARHEQPR